MNIFVDVTFIATSRRIHCQFLDLQFSADSVKQCTASVTYGSNCDQYLGTYSNMSNGKFVPTPPLDFIDSVSEYCISVTATSDNGTFILEGTLNLISSGNNNYYYIKGTVSAYSG